MNKAIFYHAGCPVCISAEEQIVNAIDQSRYVIDIIHLGEEQDKIEVAKHQGVKSVPALLIQGAVLHLNFGASLEDVKGG